jgi:DNA-binding transcriptional MerR regulator
MYSIGQLALILKVSTRTLRHYDEIGLLKPYNVNQENGYRYYGKEQISLAKNIIKLKEYGLTLEEIKELTANGVENNNEIIKKRLNIIEDEIKRLIIMKDNLCQVLKGNQKVKDKIFNCRKYEVQTVEPELFTKVNSMNIFVKKLIEFTFVYFWGVKILF